MKRSTEQVQRFSFANIEHFSTACLITRPDQRRVIGADDHDDGDADVCACAGDAACTALMKTLRVGLRPEPDRFWWSVPLLSTRWCSSYCGAWGRFSRRCRKRHR
ncbi:MAG: hypothetical protein ACLU38_15250 [Dysosmobacter sp.]